MDLEAVFHVDNGTTHDYIREKPGWAIFYLSSASLAAVVGTFGNILVIGAVCTCKTLKTTGNMFIVNLALADLCVSGFAQPFGIVGMVHGPSWFEGTTRAALCEFLGSICMTSCFCSLLNMGAISFNRYIHICHNPVYSKIYTSRNTLLMCVGLWVLSFLAEMPNFLGWGDHAFDKKQLACVYDRTADHSYTIFFVTGGILLPVVLISICYLKIFLYVRAAKKKVSAMSAAIGDSLSTKKTKESMKLARTLFIIFVVFIICWIPYATVVATDRYDQLPSELYLVNMLLAHTNSSINCLLYGFTNRNFRSAYVDLLGMKRCRRRCCPGQVEDLSGMQPSGTTKSTRPDAIEN